jgi:hypothetical protein
MDEGGGTCGSSLPVFQKRNKQPYQEMPLILHGAPQAWKIK